VRRLAFAVLTLVLAAAASAQPAPYRAWQTLETPHFRVHAPAGLEREGRIAGAAAERAWVALSRELHPPRTPIEIVVSDDADYPNGSATPVPSNRIMIFTTPPVEAEGLRLTADWVELVVTHELAHVFHLDRARGIWRAGQRVFGRVPLFFPAIFAPAWFTEGLAVHYESTLTEGGRLRGAYFRSIARAAALEGRLPDLGDVSIATPHFPGGEGVYAYGGMLVDHLARTRGDSSLRRFVDRQGAALLPFLDAGAARHAFGITFDQAFGAWRDSAIAASGGGGREPLPGWRELTTHPWLASSPRWLNDSTLVYTGSDGRSSLAAYTVTTAGTRTRLGRRSSQGASVPHPGGGLLFAQLEYTGREEVRSDLWLEREGRQVRLTHGARLVQPDVRGDGGIVAVRLAAARSSLVLLDRDAREVRVLREAGANELWSEPRWSPDGRWIAAILAKDGVFQLQLLGVDSDSVLVKHERPSILSSPSWSADGSHLAFATEEYGESQLAVVPAAGLTAGATPRMLPGSGTVVSPEWGRGGGVAATTIRADGYHVGVAPLAVASTARPPLSRGFQARPAREREVGGEYRAYSPWRTLAPTWWLPVIEDAPHDGTRLGALTTGADAVGRHAYDALIGIDVKARFSTGALAYRYAGSRSLLMDVVLEQDWRSLGRIDAAGGARIGTLLRRTRDLSLAATWVRPRARTFSSLTAGIAVEGRSYATDSQPLLRTLDTSFARSYVFPRAFVGVSWYNAQRPLLSISPEDGVALALTARGRYRTGDASRTRTSTVVGTAAGYRALDLPGFAHHVLALRAAGGWADARATSALEIGGTSGAVVEVAPGRTVGEGRETFPVRGFPQGSIRGTRAAGGTVEYRAPLALVGRGSHRIPFFLDRASVSAFADAATAACDAAPLYLGICSRTPVIGRTIASVGAELGVSLALLQVDSPLLVRGGVAVPVAGRTLIDANVERVRPVSGYVAFGLGF
jgi:hypothetical protein